MTCDGWSGEVKVLLQSCSSAEMSSNAKQLMPYLAPTPFRRSAIPTFQFPGNSLSKDTAASTRWNR